MRDGSKFRVAKKGLTPQTLHQITQHFAEGGEATGPGPTSDQESADAAADFQRYLASQQQAQDLSRLSSESYGFESGTTGVPGTDLGPVVMGQRPNLPAPLARAIAQERAAAPAMAQPSQAPAADQAQAAQRSGTGGAGPGGVAGAMSQAVGQQMPQMPSLENRDKQIMDAFGQQSSGAKGYAAAKDEEGRNLAAAYDKSIADIQNHQKDWVAQRAVLDKENQALYQNVLNSKVDPNHLWHEAGTGGRLLAGLGMVLGGIGAGLTHGQNQGMQVVQAAIDRDVSAQKENLDNKKSLLSFNLQRTHNLDEAENLTRAQLLDVARAQLGKASALAQGPEAQARAQMLDGQLKGQQEQLLNATGMQRYQQKLQTAAVSQAALQKNTVDQATARLMAGEADQGDVATAHQAGMGETVVQLHNGKWALAKGKKSAETFNESGRTIDTVADTIQRANAYVDEHGALSRNAPFGSTKALGESISASLIPQLNELANLKRLSKEDVEIMKQRLKGLTSATAGSTLKAQLNELNNELNSRIMANEHNFTYIQRRPALTPR